MEKKSLRVVARVKARSDRIGRMREILLGLIEPTRRESGCIRYDLLQNKTDPTDFTFVEEWTNESALEAHLETDHVKNALSQFGELVEGKPDIRRYDLIR